MLRCGCKVAAAIAIAALAPAAALAQAAQPGPWKYSAAINLYLPSLDATTAFPADPRGTPINVSAEQIFDRLKMAFMGTFDAHNGTWDVVTDVVYVDFGNAKSNSRDFRIGNVGIPAGTTANLDWDLKVTGWTIAGEYRVSADASLTMDLLAGARLLDTRQRLRWTISGDLGPLPPASRSGSSEANEGFWDAIVGVTGRYVVGANRRWAAPFYLDVGTGESDSTAQAAAGISYGFQWGELAALWRYIGYQVTPGKSITDISFSGPQVGAVFRW